MRPRYFNWVDALRGVAAIIVLLYHYQHFYLANSLDRAGLPPVSDFPFAAVLGIFYEHGELAVQLFWVMSGFVFMHVYMETETTLKRFAIARFARLYPLHFATLILVAVLQWVNVQAFGKWQIYSHNDLQHLVLHLLMLSDSTTLNDGLSFNGPVWSVSFELVSYALFLLCLPLLRRFGLLAALPIAAVCYGLSGETGAEGGVIFRREVLYCAFYFFGGTSLYLVFRHLTERPAALLGIVILLALNSWRCAMIDATVVAVLLGACAAVLAAACLDLALPQTGALVRPLGDISYSLYLAHVPIQILCLTIIDFVWPGYRGFADDGSFLIAYVLVSIMLARLVHRHFELPVGRAIRYGHRSAPGTTPETQGATHTSAVRSRPLSHLG